MQVVIKFNFNFNVRGFYFLEKSEILFDGIFISEYVKNTLSLSDINPNDLQNAASE